MYLPKAINNKKKYIKINSNFRELFEIILIFCCSDNKNECTQGSNQVKYYEAFNGNFMKHF
jgi:hypothetical protein